MDLKKIKLWCESLPANAEVRPIVLGLVAELEAARERIREAEKEVLEVQREARDLIREARTGGYDA